MHIYIPLLIIQSLLVLLICFVCLLIADLIYICCRHNWIIYSCSCFTQQYIKPVTTHTWAGKTYPATCKLCGTDYSHKYLSITWRFPFEKWGHFRYYRIPGFERVKIDYDE